VAGICPQTVNWNVNLFAVTVSIAKQPNQIDEDEDELKMSI